LPGNNITPILKNAGGLQNGALDMRDRELFAGGDFWGCMRYSNYHQAFQLEIFGGA